MKYIKSEPRPWSFSCSEDRLLTLAESSLVTTLVKLGVEPKIVTADFNILIIEPYEVISPYMLTIICESIEGLTISKGINSIEKVGNRIYINFKED